MSILVPVYNEEESLQIFFDALENLSQSKFEVIIFNDGSNDDSSSIINKNLKKNYTYIQSNKNKGKGYGIRKALSVAKGDICIIQDADLEYNPIEINNIYEIFINNPKIKAVYGSRILGSKNGSNFISQFRFFANKLLTFLNNLLNNQNLTDAHTCYKALDTELFKNLNLKSNGFSLCSEINTKLSNKKIRIIEVPISYKGRTADEGKKIGTADAFYSLLTILYYKIKK